MHGFRFRGRSGGPRNGLAALLLLLAAAALPGACDASISVPECDRLQNFSCDCFPECQLEYVDIVDSQDAGRCNKALRDAFAYWEICAGQCGPNCEYGWSACAFDTYQALGLAPKQECSAPPADAGTD